MKLEKKEGVSLWRRGFAFAIDIFIINLAVSIPFKGKLNNIIGDVSNKSFLEVYSYMNSISSDEMNRLVFIMSIVSLLVSLLYFVIMEYKFGQTLGKMLFKIVVKSDDKKLKLKQCLIRNITKSMFLTNLIFVLFLDLLYVIFSGNKRWTEKISNTHVEKIS